MTLHSNNNILYTHQFRLHLSKDNNTEFEIEGIPGTRTKNFEDILKIIPDSGLKKTYTKVLSTSNNFRTPTLCLKTRLSYFLRDQHGLSDEESIIIYNFINSSTYDKCTVPECEHGACLSHNISKSILLAWSHDNTLFNINDPSYDFIEAQKTIEDPKNKSKKYNPVYNEKKYQNSRSSFTPHTSNSGVKRAFCKEEHETIFSSTDELLNFQYSIDDIKTKDIMFNLLFYKSISFQYINYYDFLWQILWDQLLISYAKEYNINIYDAYMKILTITKNPIGEPVIKKDKLFDDLMVTDEKETIIRLILPQYKNTKDDKSDNSFTSKNIIDKFITEGCLNPILFQDIKIFMDYVESNNLLNDTNKVYNKSKNENKFYIAHEIFEIPAGNMLASGASLCYSDASTKDEKKYGLVAINIYPDTLHNNRKVIISSLITDIWTKEDFEKEVYGDFEYHELPDKSLKLSNVREDKGGLNKYDEYDWFAYALNKRLSSLILKGDFLDLKSDNYSGFIEDDINYLTINGRDNNIIQKLRTSNFLHK